MIAKEIMLQIANLERKEFLKTMNYLLLLHITDDNYIDEEEISKRYVGLVSQFLGEKK
jgi:hypothetical protein|tara:strand:- start:167 stop:340 length:174 start_codon:yes stop_codon:yes gene_type:complete